jgi:hypothetical protein
MSGVPLLDLVISLCDWSRAALEFDEIAREDINTMNRFCDLLSELGDRCLRGSPPQSKADKEQAEKLTDIYRRMPACLLPLVAEMAQEFSWRTADSTDWTAAR